MNSGLFLKENYLYMKYWKIELCSHVLRLLKLSAWKIRQNLPKIKIETGEPTCETKKSKASMTSKHVSSEKHESANDFVPPLKTMKRNLS